MKFEQVDKRHGNFLSLSQSIRSVRGRTFNYLQATAKKRREARIFVCWPPPPCVQTDDVVLITISTPASRTEFA